MNGTLCPTAPGERRGSCLRDVECVLAKPSIVKSDTTLACFFGQFREGKNPEICRFRFLD